MHVPDVRRRTHPHHLRRTQLRQARRGRHVAARLAEERRDEKERQRWLGIVTGPRRDGEVYA